MPAACEIKFGSTRQHVVAGVPAKDLEETICCVRQLRARQEEPECASEAQNALWDGQGRSA